MCKESEHSNLSTTIEWLPITLSVAAYDAKDMQQHASREIEMLFKLFRISTGIDAPNIQK